MVCSDYLILETNIHNFVYYVNVIKMFREENAEKDLNLYIRKFFKKIFLFLNCLRQKDRLIALKEDND